MKRTFSIEIWTSNHEDVEPVFDHMLDEHRIGRDRISDIECDETSIDVDEEGNNLATYTVEVLGR